MRDRRTDLPQNHLPAAITIDNVTMPTRAMGDIRSRHRPHENRGSACWPSTGPASPAHGQDVIRPPPGEPQGSPAAAGGLQKHGGETITVGLPLPAACMFNALRKWRERRVVARRPITDDLWHNALLRCAPARRLGASDQAALRVLATLFLDRKSVEPVHGVQLDDADRVLLATHACLPILKLGLDWYDGWHSIIVYPAAFIPRREHVDEAGVVHQSDAVLA